MKKHLIFLLASATLALGGCSEKPSGEEGVPGYGRLSVRCGADIALDSRAAAEPSGSEFRLFLTGTGYNGEWATVAEFAAQDTLFKEGAYTAAVVWGDPEAEGVDRPYYRGEAPVEILARRTVEAAIDAKIANSKTQVTATEQFLRYFHDARFTVTTGSGNAFAFAPGSATPGEAVWVKAGTTLTVTGTACKQSQTGQSEGPQVTFPEQTLLSTQPRTLHTFRFDAADAGSATLTIYLGEDYIQTVDLKIELNDDAK